MCDVRGISNVPTLYPDILTTQRVIQQTREQAPDRPVKHDESQGKESVIIKSSLFGQPSPTPPLFRSFPPFKLSELMEEFAVNH